MPLATLAPEELEDLCLDEFDIPAETDSSLIGIWREWRDAVRAHVASIAAQDETYHASQERFPEHIRHLGLPTFFSYGMKRTLWDDAAARHRALSSLPAHAYVAKAGGAYEAVCPEHPTFRRVAWTHRRTPLQSAREHNALHHGGAAARVYNAPGREPSSLLP